MRQRWVPLGILLVAGAACARAVDAREAVVRRVFREALEQGRYDVFDEAYDTTFVKHVGLKRYSLTEERAQASATHEISSRLRMDLDAVVSRGDLVAVFYSARGVFDRPVGGAPPTGRTFDVKGATLYRFKGARIAEEWTVYDRLDLAEQMGVPGAPTRPEP